MQTLIDTIRDVLGEPDFYKVLSGQNPTWDYGAMLEYMCASIILCVVIASVFKFLRCLVR